MARPTSIQIIRRGRADGSVTFALRARSGGADARVPLGNSSEGWDEARVETARKQLLAKIELGLWTPPPRGAARTGTEEPTFRELATDWLQERRHNPAIRPRTIEHNVWQLRRYLAPFFGELKPSQISRERVKEYRQRIHAENEQIRAAEQLGTPLRDAHTGLRLGTLGNESMNKTLRTLALILDEAEDAGWIDRNAARGRRMREPLERKRTAGALDVDEFLALLDAASELDATNHKPATLEKAAKVRGLRDEAGLQWREIAARLGVGYGTAIYLYGCDIDQTTGDASVRRAIVATLGLAGLRVSELCALDNADVVLVKAKLHICDAKTEAGVRTVDIQPRLAEELNSYHQARLGGTNMDAPAFPSRTGSRRDKDNVAKRVIRPVVARANELRAQRQEPPIRTHVTPHTFRRTYVSFMLAAGFELPYVQAQVGHKDPNLTLSVYAQLMHSADRDQLRTEVRTLLGLASPAETEPSAPAKHVQTAQRNRNQLGSDLHPEKVRKGPTATR